MTQTPPLPTYREYLHRRLSPLAYNSAAFEAAVARLKTKIADTEWRIASKLPVTEDVVKLEAQIGDMTIRAVANEALLSSLIRVVANVTLNGSLDDPIELISKPDEEAPADAEG